MPNDLAANPRALDEPTDSRKPISSLCREIGLAAVAIELNLELSTLQPDAAEAIEQGGRCAFRRGVLAKSDWTPTKRFSPRESQPSKGAAPGK